MRFLAILVLQLGVLFVNAQVYPTTYGNFTTSRSLNGMVAVVASSQQFQPAEVSIYVRTGSVYDRVYQTGISSVTAEIVSERIAGVLKKGNYPNIRFNYTPGYEHSIFKFRTVSSELPQLLTFINNEFTGIKIEQKDLDSIIPVINQKRTLDSADIKNAFRFTLHNRLFTRETHKMLLWGEEKDIAALTALDVDSFYRMNYVPNNATIVMTSPYDVNKQIAMLDNALTEWRKTDFNPDELTKIRNFKPMVYTTQDIVVNNPKYSTLTYASLAYGTRTFLRSTYFNYLLSALLNDTSQHFYKALNTELHPRKITTQFEAGSFFGIFKVVVVPQEEEFQATHETTSQLLAKLHEHINDSTLAKAKKKFAEEYKALRNMPEYIPMSVKFYFTNSEQYFELLNDSVQNISTTDLIKYVYTTYSTGPFAAILETDSSHLESERTTEWFENVDNTINNRYFTYRKNIADLEGEDNAQLLRELVQWLKANPDVQCQINGKADKKEYNKFSDASTFEFIDTLTTFRKYKPDFFKKKNIRLELMRSYKIVKLLVENGISLDRLAGTAMVYGSKNEEEFEANRRATLTLNRLKQRLPLRNTQIFGK